MDDVRQYMKDKQNHNLPTLAFRPPIFKPLVMVPIRVRLVRSMDEDGNKLAPFYEFGQHWNNHTKKYQICSSKWLPNEQGRLERVDPDKHRCAGCFMKYQWTPAMQRRIPKKTVGFSIKHAVTIFVMADFHLDPFDNKGQPLGLNKKGDPIYRRDLCAHPKKVLEGIPLPECKGCNRNLPKEWGRRMAWYIPKKGITSLVNGTVKQFTTCANCYTKKSIKTLGFMCPNCGYAYNTEGVEPSKIRDTEIKCQKCGDIAYPQEVMECSNCSSPRRPSLFDGDMWVMKSSDDMKAEILVHKFKVCAPHSKISEDDLKGFDFSKKLAPEPMDVQLQIHGIPSPWDSLEVAPTTNYSQPVGGPPGNAADAAGDDDMY